MLSTGYYHTRVHDAQMHNTTTKAGRRLGPFHTGRFRPCGFYSYDFSPHGRCFHTRRIFPRESFTFGYILSFSTQLDFNMSRERIIAMWLLYRRLRLRRKQRVRKYWVHPINERRNVMGTFNSLFEDLLADDNKFFNYFRMSISSFDELHNRLKCSIQRQNTKMRDCIQPKEMLAVTLR